MNSKANAFNERVSVSNTRDRLEIEISGKIPSLQMAMLFGWLATWTVAGIYVFSQLFTVEDRDTLAFMIGWLAFWAYFEFRVLNAFLWRRSGREIVVFERGQSSIEKKVPLGGSKISVETGTIRNFTNLEEKRGAFARSFFSSFWVVGGESIGFYSGGKMYNFGQQMSAEEAAKMIDMIRRKLSSWNIST